jgi:transposase
LFVSVESSLAMSRAITLPPLDAATLSDLRRRYDAAPDPDTRSRHQMILLAQQGYTAPQIATMVLCSDDTVLRVLHRFRAGGLDAVPRRYAPGGPRTVTPAWEAALLRVIAWDPHEVGVASANWTTGLLAAYLAQVTGITVDPETVRLYLHAHAYVCKRPTWTLKQKAEEQPEWVGNA